MVILYLYLLCKNVSIGGHLEFVFVVQEFVATGGHLVFVFVVQELVASVVVHVRLPSPLQL